MTSFKYYLMSFSSDLNKISPIMMIYLALHHPGKTRIKICFSLSFKESITKNKIERFYPTMNRSSFCTFFVLLPSIFGLPNPNFCDERDTNGMKIKVSRRVFSNCPILMLISGSCLNCRVLYSQIKIECLVDGHPTIDCFNSEELKVLTGELGCDDIGFHLIYKLTNKSEDPDPFGNYGGTHGNAVDISLNQTKLYVDDKIVGGNEMAMRQKIMPFKSFTYHHHIKESACNKRLYDISGEFVAKRKHNGQKSKIRCSTEGTINLDGYSSPVPIDNSAPPSLHPSANLSAPPSLRPSTNLCKGKGKDTRGERKRRAKQ